MMTYSCADFAFPLLSHEDALKLIKMIHIDFVDIGLFEDRSHIRPGEQLTAPGKNGELLKKKTADAGLGIADIFLQSSLDFTEFAINHPDPAIRQGQREVFKKLCEYALAAGCGHVSGLPGVDFSKKSTACGCVTERSAGKPVGTDSDSWSIGREELSWRSGYAKEQGLVYAVEPHAGSLIEKPEDTLRMLQEGEGLTIILDHSHYTFRGIGPDRLGELMPYASHMHIRGARKGEMQCSVARNETDFHLVAQQMQSENYQGRVCLEYTYTDWENCNRTDNVSETILLMQQMETYFQEGKTCLED